MNLWDSKNGPRKDTTMNAFFQLGAARLSGVRSEVAANAAIIDAYFTGIDLRNGHLVFPATSGEFTKDQVKDAGSSIGVFIDANHVQ